MIEPVGALGAGFAGPSEPRKEVCDLAKQLLEATAVLDKCNDEINRTRTALQHEKKPNARVDIESDKKVAEQRLFGAQNELDRVRGELAKYRGAFGNNGSVTAAFDDLSQHPVAAANSLLGLLGSGK